MTTATGTTHDTVTGRLARRVASLGAADLSGPVAERLRACVIDWVACAVAGAGQPGPAALRRAELADSGRRTSTLVGGRRRGSVELAATHNGFASHVLELDDVHLPSLSHASAPVLAAALAVGEEVGAPADEVGLALLAGYEAMARIGRPVGQRMISERHVHPTGFLGYFGAATAAARLYGLGEEQLVAAWGIAGGQAGGLTEVRGTMSKAYFAGHSAGGGVRAARLAREGFGSARDIVGGPSGIWAAFGADPDAVDPDATHLGPDGPAVLENTHKLHASCALGHPMIDVVLAARAAGPAPTALPRRLELHLPVEAATYLDRPEPVNGLDAKFSAQYCAVVAWTDGLVGPAQFEDARVVDAHGSMQRVVIVPRPEFDLARAEVRVHDGTGLATYHSGAGPAAGARTGPALDQLEAKFVALVAPVLGPDETTDLLAALRAWPDLPLAELCRRVAPDATQE
ncbi:MmgE/PrpD family protein [Nocardioides sp. L-11A]|uniref:MmgE/PrpD family protein n=1 Tax=Nocardioides sp. L-11A TaxID=3043848 RepID=UPI00249B521A|nr:MmgE/PrpD family protein [Nocardioides sp. L-11A]